MKKSLTVFTILILLFSAIACSVHAQYASRGVVEFGGSIAYSSTTVVTNGTAATQSTSLFNFMPYVSYYLVDGFSVALSPGVNIVKIAGSSNSITDLDLFVVPGYTFSTKGIVYPYIEGMLGYTALSSNSNPLGGTAKLDNSGVSFGGKAGIKLLVGKSGLFSVGVAYTLLNFSPKGATKRSGFNNLALSMGFSVFLDKR